MPKTEQAPTMGSLDLLEPPVHREFEIRKNSSSSLKLRESMELPTINENEQLNEDSAGLDGVKRVTTRLRLSTRRESILEWKENVKQTLLSPSTKLSFMNGTPEDDKDDVRRSEKQRREHIDSALEWLRSELVSWFTIHMTFG